MTALALACGPPLVIADEPTTALDVVMQAQVLQLLERLRERLGLALILISHDLGVLAETCDRVAIMNEGKIVEIGEASQIFGEPKHDYTKKLLSVLPVIGGERRVAPASSNGGEPPLIEVRDLNVWFPTRAGEAHAVDGVSFDWKPGEILGVVGESGCGKSTTARAILGLVEAQEGEVLLDGKAAEGRGEMRDLRKRIQMIFQDPYQTLNPRHRVRTLVAEPLVVMGIDRSEHETRVAKALNDVGLEPERYKDRYPHQLSGGQRQRVAIAVGAGPRAGRAHLRRAGLDAGYLGPLAGPRRPLWPSREPRARPPLHHARPEPRVVALRPSLRDVPGTRGRAGPGDRCHRAPTAPIHAGAGRRDPRAGSRWRRAARPPTG